MAKATKTTTRITRSKTTVKPATTKPEKPKAAASSVPHVAPAPAPETPKFIPRVEQKVEPPPAKSNVAKAMWAGAAALVVLLAVLIYVQKPQDTAELTALKSEVAALKAAKTPTSGPVKAFEVEVIPLTAVKTDTHAHVLHGQKCTGNEGKKVKVRIEVNGRTGWDWYTCPKKA